MARVSKSIRDQVFRRANGCCEYCQTQAAIVIVMNVEHITPIASGGGDDLDNLCLSCPSSNSAKLDFVTGIDPETGEEAALFNPRTQNWHEHFAWSEEFDHIEGLTIIGRSTIARLRMNREEIVLARQRWVKVGWHPPKD